MPDLEAVLRLHFDRETGAPYWLERQAALGLDVPRAIRSPGDFHRLGPMDAEAMRRRPLEDFVPKPVLARRSEMVLAETGGTTGAPCRRVYLPEEFAAAFVEPWARAAAAHGFPRGVNWLWAGPSGPHVIGQAARAMARRLGSLEPFSVDCDPRWVRRQEPGSLGHRLYVDHVVEQSLGVLRTQSIEAAFTTPPILAELAARMSEAERRRIRGIHLGGLPVDGETCRRARTEWFPAAALVAGYGNSLMGVAFEQSPHAADHEPRYHVDDPALWLQVAPDEGGKVDLARTLAPGERGRVVVHRLDSSFLLLNWIERDAATVESATAFGDGALRAVGPAAMAAAPVAGAGLY